jgi:hypothetical protein
VAAAVVCSQEPEDQEQHRRELPAAPAQLLSLEQTRQAAAAAVPQALALTLARLPQAVPVVPVRHRKSFRLEHQLPTVVAAVAGSAPARLALEVPAVAGLAPQGLELPQRLAERTPAVAVAVAAVPLDRTPATVEPVVQA